MSQMTASEMSIRYTTTSLQPALSQRAGPRVVRLAGRHDTADVFLEGFFLPLTGPSVRDEAGIELPFGQGKTSPVGTADVAQVIAGGFLVSGF